MKQDFISANLPAINFEETRKFYTFLGFQCTYQSSEWMILRRDQLILEFFLYPQLDIQQSWHSASIRVQDLQNYYQQWIALDWNKFSAAKITAIQQNHEIKIFNIVDINGSLLRCIQSE
ncbi:hypothetical protein B9T31_11490 [Acinetobacter sp. ANC 4558]|uniref:hypothetical protein n=1 Tax=Acinetobacter sp. ANC 4558 TaxID=1977876 RepID=UPI000A34D966|nr:hypothetical protein [Acinetobacter sp. ANC 4558]OTG85415.1 hypothetical protein B9T31_11490 [Acinetobacter sp. ANC 4558]